MVAISRVFDIEGLWEVLGDISHSSVPDSSLTPENEPLKPVTIPGTEDSEDEITPPEVTIQNSAIVEEGTEIVVVDTLTQIITELFTSREKSAGAFPLSSRSSVYLTDTNHSTRTPHLALKRNLFSGTHAKYSNSPPQHFNPYQPTPSFFKDANSG